VCRGCADRGDQWLVVVDEVALGNDVERVCRVVEDIVYAVKAGIENPDDDTLTGEPAVVQGVDADL